MAIASHTLDDLDLLVCINGLTAIGAATGLRDEASQSADRSPAEPEIGQHLPAEVVLRASTPGTGTE